MTRATISAVVPTLNESANLPYLLPTIGWCDEIVVVDQGSTDGTREIAQQHGARVLEVEWRPDFDACRATGATEATGDWILQLDADEMVTRELAERLRQLAQRPDIDIVATARLNSFLGPLPAGGLWPDTQFRFFRRGSVELGGDVHSYYRLRSEKVHYLPARRELALRHFPYRGASDHLRKLDRYTNLELRKESEARRPGLSRFLGRPLRVFLSRYFKHGAFRYGWRGLWLSVYWAFYFFLCAVKAWEKRQLPIVEKLEAEQKEAILRRFGSPS